MPHLRILSLLFVAGALLSCSALEEGPEDRDPDFYNHNAQRLYDGGHYRQALDQFEKALAIDDTDQTALLGRAWTELLLGESLILGNDPDGAEILQRSIGHFEELKSRRLGENTYKVWLGLGRGLALRGDLYRDRVALLQAEADRMPPSEERNQAIARTRDQMNGEYTAAEALFKQTLAEEDVPGARENLNALIGLAGISVSRERYADALTYAKRYLALVVRSKKEWLDARLKYPEDAALWEVKLAGAVRKEVAVRDLLASALVQLDRYEEAEEELHSIVKLDPDFGDAFLRRGIVREKLGNRRGALEDFEMFLLRAARIDIPAEDPRVVTAVARRDALRQALGIVPPAGAETRTGPASAGGR